MLSIPGYQITETLYSGNKTLVYRGYREHDRCPFIFKTVADDYPAAKDLARLQHEYALTKNDKQGDKQSDQQRGRLRSEALLKHHNTLVLLQHDIGGVALNRLLAGQALPLERFLVLALALARDLSRIHQCHLIHKDINPSNLVVNINTRQVQIIDFGIATRLSRETTQLQNPGHLEGTLAYLSPEQTGRMNRVLDYRSDFYSLGATFYEMLSGTPPFAASDPMALVHCHLAKTPQSLHELRPEIPPVLDELVQKLMAKTAEARYQSAFGLIADLETCQRLLTPDNKTIAHFPIAQHDVSGRFQIPQKLYGRETEVKHVLDAFARVSQGQTEILLIAGYSGIGKTALVHEIHKPITEKNGYCIDGKFDQFQRNIPYASLIQAFQELVRQLLTESPAKIARWKSLLEQALGAIAQVILDVIPEVEWIMGPQAAVPELPPSQAQNRLNLAFRQFIRTFTTEQHPLVLFLDDLQWADLPSLQLIQLFMSDPETGYLLFIGAYRDNEVTPAHPLMLTLDEIRKAAIRMTSITLTPLDQAHVQHLLAESLHCAPEQCASLARLCLTKTRGNPFFLGQFLHTLVDAQQITFNHVTGRWEWDIASLQQTPMTTNVVDLMAETIKTLPPETQALLQLAACVGNQFDLHTLAWAQEQSVRTCAATLWPALEKNLVVPLDDAYKYIGFDAGQEDDNRVFAPQDIGLQSVGSHSASFKFVHDRVQQAAYSLIAEEAKAIFHLRIGRRLLANMTPPEREERIFDLVYQWNQGQTLLTTTQEKQALAQLNLLAGKKAAASSAYMPALAYFQTGMALTSAQAGWEQHYELTLALFVGATEAAYLTGDFAQMNQLAAIVLQNARSLLDRVPTYQIQIEAGILQNQSLEAIRIALPVLRQLGVKVPAKGSKWLILRGLLETKWALRGKSDYDLIQSPPMTEPLPIAAMKIISSLGSAAYLGAPELFPLIIFKEVNLTVQYGNSVHSAHAYAAYALILSGALNQIKTGYRFGKLAVSILENFPLNASKVKIGMIREGFLNHWTDSLHNRPAQLLQVYQDGLQSGNYEYAAYSATFYCTTLFFTGKSLGELKKEVEKYAQAMVQFKQAQVLQWQNLLAQTIVNLSGGSDDPCCLTGIHFDEATLITAENRTSTFLYHFYKLLPNYLFGRYPQGLEQAIMAEQYLDGMVAHPAVPICHFYMALVRLALFPQAQTGERKQFLKIVAATQKKLKYWAQHAPVNHLHKWHLVEAERERVTGNDLRAMSHYDQAILLAKKHSFPQEAALANELAARFHLARGREKLGRGHLQDAHYGYRQWGALAKTRQLEQQFPQWFAREGKHMDARTDSVGDAVGGTVGGTVGNTMHGALDATIRSLTTDGTNAGVLDLATVMKASQSISGEIILERLLEKLMRIALENAGAQKGMLLLKQGGEWRIEAEGNMNGAQAMVLQSLPLNPDLPDARLPLALVQYVELSKEALVLDNASGQGRFVNDPYIRQNRSKSVLCLSILLQGKLAGMLYLENNLTENAFTADRLAVLKILLSQAAISIDNARVYQHLEATVAQRTAALSDSNAALSDSHTALSDSHTALSNAYAVAETARQQAESAERQARQALNDLRAAQSQLVQSAKMASLGHLVAGVAHELNTPIGNALTTASVLADASHQMQSLIARTEIRKAALTDFIDDTVAMTDVISRSCQRAATLINSFKQVAVDQTSEQRRSFDLEALVKDNLAALTPGFSPNSWQIETAIPVGLVCDSYPGPLGQIVANLVQNAAVHAFAEQRSGTLKIDASVRAGTVEILFSDDGVGMEAAILTHIFEPFYTTQMGSGGPGLGLSIALNIATGVLGGTLRASSTPGCGSQFCLTFPLKAPDRTGSNNHP